MSVGLQGDSSLQQDKVKFIVQTKGRGDPSDRLLGFRSCLPHFAQTEFSVMRQHEEFIWLHDVYEEGVCRPPCEGEPAWENRGGGGEAGPGFRVRVTAIWIMRGLPALSSFEKIPPAPPRPDSLRLQRKNCRSWMRKTAQSRGKTALLLVAQYKWVLSGSHRRWMTSLSMRTFLLEYHACIQDACLRADQVGQGALMGGSISASLAGDYMPISAALTSLGSQEVKPLLSFFKLAELFERLRELEGQVASGEDLKLLDMLRYYMRDSQAAKARAPGLLFWQLLALADYKNANKALDRAKPSTLCLSDSARQELMDFKSHDLPSMRTSLSWASWSSNMPRWGNSREETSQTPPQASTLLLRSTLVILKGEP
ncbi:hypothetical protein FD754_010416 [Muntiacus muntjak]|uniref:Uncharacterized protein n=1 Tax=Muntiacus muntjak TaxID=9888 RepID=A0A5N3WWS7_MUNMU|nr:hypothetical protein FD754_010416 [Muntiacus muntjak]